MAEGRPAATGVLASVQTTAGSDASLREVVSSALAVQLARRQARLELAEIDGAPQSSRTNKALSEAADRNAQYLLLGEYTTTPRDFTVQVDLYDVATARKLKSSTASGRIDLSLDAVVADAMDQALSGIEFRLPDARSGDVSTTTDGQSVARTGPAAGALSPAGRAVKRFVLSSGVAPFIPMGGASEYATLGVLATLSANMRFVLGPGIMGAGLLTGACIINATGAASDADVLIVPIGADLQYSMNEGGFPGIVVHLSGGPALMNVDSPYAGSMTKVIPYVLAGMTLSMPFTPSIGLAVETAWAMFLESASLPIMAFAPEASLYVRF